MAVAAGVPARGPGAAEVVPQTHLVSAEGAPPQRVADDHDATRSRHTQHLVGHLPRTGRVLDDVRRHTDVDGPIGERQLLARCPDGSPVFQASRVHLGRVRLHRQIRRPAAAERVGEVAGPAADVEHHRTVEFAERAHEIGGVVGERAVEAGGIGLLVAEVVQQASGTSQRGEPGHGGVGTCRRRGWSVDSRSRHGRRCYRGGA